MKKKLVGRFKGKTNRLVCGKILYTMEFERPEDANLLMEEMQDEWLEMTFQKASEKRKKRSLSANAYAWVLIGDLASVQMMNKEEVYRKEVKDAGVYDVIKIKTSASDFFKKEWNSRGIGFFTEEIGKDEEHTELIVYYGSSCYDTKQMARLIDNIVNDCKELGIPVMNEREISLLKEEWK